jgi:acetamidase/formamidase
VPAGHEHKHSLHKIRSDAVAFGWDNSARPVLEIESGEIVELETTDASGGQLTADSTAADVRTLNFDYVNPITGPVYVRGAEPGDVLAVEILELRPRDWGWTAIIPGFGLLADEFTEPWLRISQRDGRRGRVSFANDFSLPFAPFPGSPTRAWWPDGHRPVPRGPRRRGS